MNKKMLFCWFLFLPAVLVQRMQAQSLLKAAEAARDAERAAEGSGAGWYIVIAIVCFLIMGALVKN